jgi:tripartite-type tricarboxylate transporter receptor subunit TctC
MRKFHLHDALAAIAAACLAFAPAVATAQSLQPGKPIRFLVGYPPGGGTDLVARLVGGKLAERLELPVVVENRVGAAGNIAMDAIAKAAPDGHTIALGVSGMTINATLMPELTFDPVRDFAPVSKLANNPLVLVVVPSFQAKDLRALVAEAKAQPGKLNYGTPGNGTGMHMMGELLNGQAEVKLSHVPYKGNGPLVNDLLGGHIPVGISDLASTIQFIKAGKLHPIGIGSPARTPIAPELPTLAESGLPGFAVLSWTGVVAPARTPAGIVERLNAEIRSILGTPEVRDKMLAAGLEPAPTTVAEFAEIIRSDIAKWAKVIKAAGIKSNP